MAETKRRARGEDSIYYDRSRDRWTGTITVGWKPDGRRDRVTVEHCLKDWLATLKTQAETTVTGYRIMARHLLELIGNVKLAELKVRDVQFALGSWLSACQPGALGWHG